MTDALPTPTDDGGADHLIGMHLSDIALASTSGGAQSVTGLSAQSTAYQLEAVERLHRPYPLLSDENGRLAGALKLPTFTVAGLTLLKRMTLVVDGPTIRHVFYPVFPADAHAEQVRAWLRANPAD